MSRFWLLTIALGIMSCRAQIDVKTAKGPAAPAATESPTNNPDVPLPDDKIPDLQPKTGTAKPIREILPAATNNFWQTRSFIKIQLADDIGIAATNSLVLTNQTTGIELDHSQFTVDACGSFKCILIPARFSYEGNPFFAYGVNEIQVISEGASEDLRMTHKLTLRDFRVFGSFNHVPSAVESSSSSVLRSIGDSHVSIAPPGATTIPKSYFTGHWQEQVERP
jgi:hypothetical protein